MTRHSVRHTLIAFAAALGFAAVSPPSSAHHSTAAYNYGKSVMLSGTVKEYQWTNPHMYIILLVPGADGKMTQWTIECGTPNINVRHGWSYSDVKVGDRVRVMVHPMWDSQTSGTLDTIWTAGGKMLYAPGHDLSQQEGVRR